jgi:uncharacterized membrane protein YeaQ/YmgE (transglycosylase-associated protein family)
MNILISILLGALVGWIASRTSRNARIGTLANIIVGIVGTLAGSWIAYTLGVNFVGISLTGLLFATGSALILLLIAPSVWPQNSIKPTNPNKVIKDSVSSKAPAKKAPSGIIFLSYRRADSADISGRIYDRLLGAFDRIAVFKDVDSIPLGTDFKDYLDEKVSECNVLLAVIGDKWLEAGDTSGKRHLDDPKDFVRIEIESALARNIPVIPLLVRGASMPSEEELPTGLKKLAFRNGTQIRSDPDFHRDMDRLISALQG